MKIRLILSFIVFVFFCQGCSSPVLLNKGKQLIKEQKYSEAIALYTNLINENKFIADAYCDRSKAYMLSKSLDLALLDSEKLEEIEGLTPRVLSLKGRILAEKNYMSTDAINLCKESLRKDKKNFDGYLCLYDIYYLKYDLPQTLYWLDEGLKYFPNNIELLTRKANTYTLHHLDNESIKIVERILSLNQKDSKAAASLSLFGHTFVSKANGDYNLCIKYSDSAIKLLPKFKHEYNWNPYYDKALCQAQSGLLEEALETINASFVNVNNGQMLADLYELRASVYYNIRKDSATVSPEVF